MRTVFPVLYKAGKNVRVGGTSVVIASASRQDAPAIARQHIRSRNKTAEYRAYDGRTWVRESHVFGASDTMPDTWSFLDADVPAGPQMKVLGRYSRLELNPLVLSGTHYRNLQAVLGENVAADDTDDTPEASGTPVASNLALQAQELLDLEGQIFHRSVGPELVLAINDRKGPRFAGHDSYRGRYHAAHMIGSFRADEEDEMREACAMAGIDLHRTLAGTPATLLEPDTHKVDPYPPAMEAAGWTVLAALGNLDLPQADPDVLTAYLALRAAMYARVPDADRRIAGFFKPSWPHPGAALDFADPEDIAPFLQDVLDAAGDRLGRLVEHARLAIARTALRPGMSMDRVDDAAAIESISL